MFQKSMAVYGYRKAEASMENCMKYYSNTVLELIPSFYMVNMNNVKVMRGSETTNNATYISDSLVPRPLPRV
jgi:hypothetical protein